MSTLDDWEAEAGPNYGHDRDRRDHRILALIELVRRKDEALEMYAQETRDGYADLTLDALENINGWKQNKAMKALALTEELKC